MRPVGRVQAAVIAVIALGIGWLSYAIGVGSLLGQRAEESVLDASAFNPAPPAPLSLVSIPALGVALLVLAVIAWVARGPGRALWLLLFSSLAVFASQLLKEDLLVRPELLEFEASNTFPSGHMTVFTVLVAGLLWALPSSTRGVVGLLGAGLLGVVAWQLLAFGWHRPSDLIGAQALSVFAFALAAATRVGGRRIRPALPGVRTLNRLLGLTVAIIGAIGVAAGLVLASYAALQRSDSLILIASELGMIGASALTARVLMTLTR